eukprot:gene19466-biopygen38228
MHQRCIRLPAGNCARAVAERTDPPDPRRPNTWRARARRVAAAADLPAGVEPIATHTRADPWDGAGDVDFYPELVRKVNEKKNTPAQLRAAALETLAQRPPASVEAYTDGMRSVLDPRMLRTGGGGYVLRDAAGALHSGKCAAGAVCTFYIAELRALRKLLDDLRAPATAVAVTRGAEIRVGLDSQSAIRALAKGPTEQAGLLEMSVWERLTDVSRRYGAHFTIQYVPGHVEVAEQEEADRVAKEAARECPQESVPPPLGLAAAAVSASLRRHATESIAADHIWMKSTGGTPPRLDHTMPREAQRRLAQLRTGHCRLLASWQYRAGRMEKKIECPARGPCPATRGCVVTDAPADSPAAKAGIRAGWRVAEVDGTPVATDAAIRASLARARGRKVPIALRAYPSPACPVGCGEEDSVQHLIAECLGYTAARHRAFGTHHPPLTVLRERPMEVWRYLRAIGRSRPPVAEGG